MGFQTIRNFPQSFEKPICETRVTYIQRKKEKKGIGSIQQNRAENPARLYFRLSINARINQTFSCDDLFLVETVRTLYDIVKPMDPSAYNSFLF